MIEENERKEDDYDAAMARFLKRAREPRRLEWLHGRKPTRDELHERDGKVWSLTRPSAGA